MNNLQDTETKCHVCGGVGYTLDERDMEMTTITKKCGACHGTGLSPFGRAMGEAFADELESVFTCKICGAKKAHYRLRGYVCMGCERRR